MVDLPKRVWARTLTRPTIGCHEHKESQPMETQNVSCPRQEQQRRRGMRTVRRLSLALAVATLGTLASLTGAGITHAAGVTYTVALGGTATCSSGEQNGANFGTIQAAIDCATADNPPAGSPDTITIAAGTYDEQLVINTAVNLVGEGDAVVDGNNSGRVVTIYNGPVSMTNLSIQDGNSGYGGGVLSFGTLTLDNSSITDNSASYGAGGIVSYGTLTLDNSSITGNSAGSGAGGIFNYGGTLTLSNSIVRGNEAGFLGGGIMSLGTAPIIGSNVTDNTAPRAGGIFNESGTMTVSGATVRGNTAGYRGGGILNTATLVVSSSNVVRNAAPSGSGIYNAGLLTLTDSPVQFNTPATDQCHNC